MGIRKCTLLTLLLLLLLTTSGQSRRRHHGRRTSPASIFDSGIQLPFLSQYSTVTLHLPDHPSLGTASRGNRTALNGQEHHFDLKVLGRHLRINYCADRDSIFLPDAEIRLVLDDDVTLLAREPGAGAVSSQLLSLADISGAFVSGRVDGDRDSSVAGFVSRGSFDGIIRMSDGEHYHLESASTFFRNHDAGSADGAGETVVYRGADVMVAPELDSTAGDIICPALVGQHAGRLTDGVKALLSRIVSVERGVQSAPVVHRIRIEGNLDADLPPPFMRDGDDVEEYYDYSTYETWTKDTLSDDWGMAPVRRNQGTECHLRLVIDRTFYREFAGGDAARAVREVGQRIREADRLFRQADFNGDGRPDGIGFRIKAVDVLDRDHYREYTDDVGIRHPNRSFGSDSGVDKQDPLVFLLGLIDYDFSDVCMGFVFTHRPLFLPSEGKTNSVREGLRHSILGAAFTGSLKMPTGVCSPRVHLRGTGRTMASLNIGFVTTRFDDSDSVVPRARHVMAITHEMGHAFGAPHDDEEPEGSPDQRLSRTDEARRRVCDPKGWDNKYLMTSTSPLQSPVSANNRKFSVCSRVAIKRYLNAKGFCLKPRRSAT